MILEVISATFSSAVAIMVSPIPLIALIMVLMGGKPGPKGLAFTLGWYVAVMGLVYLAIEVGASLRGDSPNLLSGIVQLLIGLLFAYIAFKQLYTQYRDRKHPTLPPWLEKVASLSPIKVFGLAAVLTFLNAKNIPVAIQAVHRVSELDGGQDMSGVQVLVAALLFTTITAIPYIGVTLWANFGGDGVTRGLERLKTFMTHYNHLIMGGLFTMLASNGIGAALGIIAQTT